MRTAITGVILAGGKSSRMGIDKALLKLHGRPFVAHVASMMQTAFDRVVLIANDPALYHFLGLEIFGDIYQDCGPLGGIHSGLVHAGGANIFVCACDTPLITRELIQHIASEPSTAAIVVPSFNKRIHPLCGLYAQTCLPVIVDRLESRRLRVLDLVDQMNASILPITPDLPFYRADLFSNFNTPEDCLPPTDNS
jgi:molybdopterin-guanine dinucleotide biosynthesis protein A